jgi:ring-1,2-phenylacetyl-CoA epoxidase subunit PaaC
VTPDLRTYALGLGDDALVLAQRLAGWSARAPEIEEDIALANLALDLLGQARALLTYAGSLETPVRTEDELAYLRDEREFTNLLLVEQDNGDFAKTIARQLLFSSYQLELYRGLTSSRDETLAGVAAKAVKEVAYHRDHAATWALRLGDGTEESHRRFQTAVDGLWPFTAELFAAREPDLTLAAAGLGVDASTLRPAWDSYVSGVLAEATVTRPEGGPEYGGGRDGLHTEGFGFLLAEMQHLARSHPEATW